MAEDVKQKDQRKAAMRKKTKLKTAPSGAEDQEANETGKFPVVGIGASAGGLEAFEQFFRNLPQGIAASFVLIQHLGTEHPSILRDLVERFTRLPVHEVTEGMRIEPEHVYVIPSKVYMAMDDGKFKLTERAGRPHVPMPIDFFFRSLAKERAERSVAILLSGTGSDGTLGLRDINGAGGVTMVQDPKDARFPGMPESAINMGHVDYVLPASQMGRHVKTILERLQPKREPKPEVVPPPIEHVLGRILSLVRLQTHHDFSHYKKSTIIRRIERRMIIHSIVDPEGYVRYLEEHREEVALLFNEFLIRVTSFFRDPEAFETLKRDIVPRLLADKPDSYTVRIWVPGCSTGEEAYSIAMLFHEYLDGVKKGNEIQIFATDIDIQAVDKARIGTYPANIVEDVGEDRLRRFFIREENGYRIKKDIREKIVFAVQDLIKDPPFTRLDLLSCRNVLIYMDSELQSRIIPLFHYSLKSGGVLFLGPSEGIAAYTDLFSTVDRKWKLFEARMSVMARPVLPDTLTWTPIHGRPKEQVSQKPSDVLVADVIRKRLLRHFTPPAIVVDEKGVIVFIQGETGRYLQPAEGVPHMNVFDMAREGMRAEVRLAVTSAREQKKEAVYRELPVKTNGDIQRIDLRAMPLTEPGTEGFVLVVFEEIKAPRLKEAHERTGKTKYDAKIVEHLQEELRLTKEHLQATVEELQSSNEELRSANEELQSTNEEIQSTNEELETSREELQSVNEELVTVNAELQSKIEQLSRTEIDMKNLLEGMRIATIFVDNDMCVVRFTEEATKLVNLIPSDAGRPLSDIVTKLKYDRMIPDAMEVVRTLQFKEVPLQIENGDWYQMRIMPYKNQEQVVQGVVITFAPAKEFKVIERLSSSMKAFAGLIVETSNDPLAALDQEFTVIAANRAFCKLFGVKDDGCSNRSIHRVVERHLEGSQLQAFVKELTQKGRVDNRALEYGGDGGTITISGSKIEECSRAFPCIVLRIKPGG